MTVSDTTVGYYGQPVVKAPVWKSAIAWYFFTGGVAGASSTLGFAAGLLGNRRLARSALLASAAGIAVSGPLLVADLGRPARFLNMLRVAKPTSPMSVGSWILTAFAPASMLAAGSALTSRLPRIGRGAAGVAAVLGPAVATYTAVLVADTAIPAWHDAHRELPYLFVGSAAASAGGIAMAFTPVPEAGPARRLALMGAALEVEAFRRMESGLGEVAGPYRGGRAGRLAKAAEACTATGALLVLAAGRRRPAAVVAGALLCAGSLLTRFSVFRAGFESAADPTATIGPQRYRLTMTVAPEFEARRQAIVAAYLRPASERPASSARGVHHLALICSDVEQTVRFYQEVLGFPLVDVMENRDYPGSTHFFHDIGNDNLLAFFDFPGLGLGQAVEAVGAVQHVAISVDRASFDAVRDRLDSMDLPYLGPDRGLTNSIYVKDPDGVQIELLAEPLRIMDGRHLG